MRAALRNPVVQFLALGAVTLAAILVGSGVLSSRAASTEAVSDARSTTELLGRSVAQPAIPRGLVDGDAGAVDRLDRSVLTRLLVGDVRRIKIWAGDGRIVYSDRTELIGEQFVLGDDELEILESGGSEADVSDLSKPENRFERGGGGLLEVYTRIESPEGEPLLFEAYYSAADIEARKVEVFRPFRRITLSALAVLVGVATPMLWVLTRRLTRAATERQRLLEAAVEASDAERRRIARDLHDGVVQDLAGTAFSVSALARVEGDPERRAALDRAAGSLRDGLRSLRSLLVEIHPPDLRAEGLRAALVDLTAPAQAAGIHAEVEVEGIEGVSAPTVALVWRVAQEAVRNAIRHAHASTLHVRVGRLGSRVVLEVVDDGVGFQPAETPATTSFGLRGLNGLVADSGGSIVVDSLPGQGTTVRMEVTVR